jgi:heat shock protein HtpX
MSRSSGPFWHTNLLTTTEVTQKLGPSVRRTQMAMIRTFRSFGSLGEVNLPALVAVLFTVVMAVLNAYWKLFLRAINFVSRKQEYRADELACIIAGPKSLIEGLHVLHSASMAWPSYWKNEVAPMLGCGCLPSIAAGFSQFLAVPSIAKNVEKNVGAQIRDAKTEPYDSHPPLRDRIAAAKRLPGSAMDEDVRPASVLFNNLEQAESDFLEAMNPDQPKSSLKRVSWEERGTAFLIPQWSKFASQYAPLLQGMTASNLPQTLGRVPDIALEMRDPPGMLLTRDQRVSYADLVATAFALLLINDGWQLHSMPGEFFLIKNGKQVDPFLLTQQISDGTIRGEVWTATCKELGIEDLPLASPGIQETDRTQDQLSAK